MRFASHPSSHDASVTQLADVRLADSDARTPSGVPLALAVSTLIEEIRPPDRHRFLALLRATERSLRSGKWWLHVEQRRAYNHQLRE